MSDLIGRAQFDWINLTGSDGFDWEVTLRGAIASTFCLTAFEFLQLLLQHL